VRTLGRVGQLIPLHRRERLRRYTRRLSRLAWLGILRRTTPLSESWGFDRGTPVDRYYIERFLDQHRSDIRGRVLEVKDSAYSHRYGSDVCTYDVLDIDPSNPHATIIADLADADTVPDGLFDCFILTQTLQFIYDTRAALSHAHRMLRPGGVLLLTVPTVSRLDRRLPDYWRFTAASCTQLLGDTFGEVNVTVRAHGNVLTAIAFLTGMAYEELSRRVLEEDDRLFPVMVTIRARKTRDGDGQ
jgi:SAM-dependent methyltransferase